MTLTESVFHLSSGHNLATYHKKPAKDHHKAIILLHGYAEYTDRYRSFITRLSNEGYHVFAIDHVGHGRSSGTQALISSVSDLTSDVSEWFVTLKQNYPEMQWYVFGHSMGGGIAIDFALKHQSELKAMILSAPLIVLPDTVPEFVKGIGRIIAKIVPSLPLIPLDADALSRDPGVVKRYLSEPRVYSGRVKAGTAIALDSFATKIQQRLSEIDLPFWVGHGTLDRVTDPAGSKMLRQRSTSTDKTYKAYNGLFHELLNEPESEVVIHDILHWLRKH